MQSWQSSLLGIRALPRDLSEFELQAFFTFGADERRLLNRWVSVSTDTSTVLKYQ